MSFLASLGLRLIMARVYEISIPIVGIGSFISTHCVTVCFWVIALRSGY